jgi:uncharacterized membrane protein
MSPDTSTPGSRFVTVRNAFISGALILAPLIVTILAFTKLIEIVGGTFRPLWPQSLQRLPFVLDLLTTGVVIVLVTGLGYLSNYVLGKYFLSAGERIIQRVPAVGTVYNSVKQIVATFGKQKRNVFSRVVMIEFPRKSAWVLAFLTNKHQGEVETRVPTQMWTVFVPTTPNPTSGFLVMVPRHEIIELDMSVGEGMKMIISGGAVVPPWPPAKSDGAVSLPRNGGDKPAERPAEVVQ